MKTVFITGANRGLGLEFTRQYAQAGYQVIATTRAPLQAEALQKLAQAHNNIQIMSLDITDEKQLAGVKSMLQQQAIDILIANAGYYGPKDERNAFGQIDSEEWLKTFQINTIAPLKLVETLYPNLQAGAEKKIAILSSKMGSIDDNSSGGSYIYRSSKTALNAVIKSLSVDLKGDGIKVVSLHPGWVKTDMGGPNALIDSETSVKGMMGVIKGLTGKKSGTFIAYDGKQIAW
ncbi:SDR family oxidoreductase [Catenovulum sediminis]|uniref:SDR family oxidoreductase n=1 Tax=Catenovulum sediminis TaxID=1740262 RepID=A0ABV1RE50_9ALTE|nr:SDR family oxidoreductase [Catenovulum sediminis]